MESLTDPKQDPGQFFQLEGSAITPGMLVDHQFLAAIHIMGPYHSHRIVIKDFGGQNRPHADVSNINEVGEEGRGRKKARTKRSPSGAVGKGNPLNRTKRRSPRKVGEQAPEDHRERLFACPFHQNSLRHTARAGSGEEHIQRKHYFEGQRCARCLDEFPDLTDLNRRMQADPPCTKRERDDACIWKIDDAQMSMIQKRLRSVSDEQKWDEIYRIIFRPDPTADIPSPCKSLHSPSPLARIRTDKISSLSLPTIYGPSLAAFMAFLGRLSSASDTSRETQKDIKAVFGLAERFRLELAAASPSSSSSAETRPEDAGSLL
ncbi:hypothetical protein GGS23DRAFT_594804 [Durotheca rogersii]|uniref:uncharacterized protein n=1 Tax=Durotheca rogersii TaxID=419775 RepID=UPI0022201D25|nr:uncharacterized protein GGS23DRAFT_594804 [Durotheca rogersii]KAI5865263.1 hypothetical protein GGS23DRAFT_594804 [Durotheca rogersii]